MQNANGAKVTLWDHETYDADLVGIAPNYDLAVLRINGPPREPAARSPSAKAANLQVGQKVFAIGNPFGLDQTLTTGVLRRWAGRSTPSPAGRSRT